ncbi:MAG: hypothetical protein K2I97_00700, partial [Alistipes sp.]|nr:hypothetical protein [Alistipes sp.]
MKTGFSVFLLLGLLLGPTALVAQSLDDEHTRIVPSGELTQPDGTDARPRAADTLVTEPSKGLIRRIFDYFDSSNVDRTFEKKIDWSIAPGPN